MQTRDVLCCQARLIDRATVYLVPLNRWSQVFEYEHKTLGRIVDRRERHRRRAHVDPFGQLLVEAHLFEVRPLRAGGPGGKGSAIASSIEWLQSNGKTQAVLVMDADGQHPPATIPTFLTAAARAELVVGDRSGDQRRMPLVRRVSNLAASQLLAARTGVEVSDSQCGMRLLRGRALHEIPPGRGGYEAESEHLKRCLLAGVSVEWVPIPAIYDGESSSFRGLRDGARVAWTLMR